MRLPCDVMHVELCPMNSLLQRAGRCARFKNEKGEVYVYWEIELNSENFAWSERNVDPGNEETATHRKSFLPYSKVLCEQTWQVLQEHTESSCAYHNVGFSLEQQWINRVHLDENLRQAERRKNDSTEFERHYNAAIFRGDRSTADDLIRSVDSRSVFVWDAATLIDFNDDEQIDPKTLVAFSVPIATLCQVWQEKQNMGYEVDWLFKRIEMPKTEAAETYAQPSCKTINSCTELKNSGSPRVAMTK
jgi:CRISPR-associated endonuclease/helicase Cas3